MRHGRERPGRDRAGQGEDQGDRAGPARGGQDRPRLRPVGADPALDRQPEVTLVEIILTVALVIFLFLWHIPSALIPIITIPFAILISFIPFRLLGMTANIMSLGGIAIAIGALVDAAIVVVEQTHKKLEQWERTTAEGDYRDGRHRGRQGGRRPELLRAAGDRGLVPPRADPGSPGRAPLQAARLHQEPRHDHRRGPGDHPRPGAAAALHPPRRLRLPAALACRRANTVLVGTIHPEEKHPSAAS